MGVLAQAWPGLKSVIMIESTREFINGRQKWKSKERSKGKPSTDWRYCISSHTFDASEFNRKVRAHLVNRKQLSLGAGRELSRGRLPYPYR